MAIDLNSIINSCSRTVFGSDLLNSILSSSIFMAIVITLVMLLIIMIIYPAKKGTGFVVIAKMGLYMFLISFMLIFLHDSVLKYTFEEKTHDRSADEIMKGMNSNNRDPVANSIYSNISPESVREAEPKTNETTGGDEITPDSIQIPVEPLYPGSIVNGGGYGALIADKPPTKNINPYQ